jgi:hypothetical protein
MDEFKHPREQENEPEACGRGEVIKGLESSRCVTKAGIGLGRVRSSLRLTGKGGRDIG